LLGLPFIQRLGDWSYSIYLWHWPTWVFALSWLAVRGYDVGSAQKIAMVGASLALGALSYRYVEQPVRTQRDFWTSRRLLAASGASFAGFAGFVSLAFLNHGFPGRLPEYLLPAELARRSNTPRDKCFRNANSTKKTTETYCSFGSAQPRQSVRDPVGDLCQPVSRAGFAARARQRIHGLIATQSACRAFVDDAAVNAGDQPPCRQFNRRRWISCWTGGAEHRRAGSIWGSGLRFPFWWTD
jgi:hypothetical protein